jgi:hypothetical protein
MIAELRHLLQDDKARQQMTDSGLQTVRARHTCAHRAEQLVEICGELARLGVSRNASSVVDRRRLSETLTTHDSENEPEKRSPTEHAGVADNRRPTADDRVSA